MHNLKNDISYKTNLYIFIILYLEKYFFYLTTSLTSSSEHLRSSTALSWHSSSTDCCDVINNN